MSDTRGFTLMEAVVSVALAAVLLSVYTSMLGATVFLRRAQYNVQAANFIQEGIDSLRTLDFAALTTRTDGRPLGVAYDRGPWQVKAIAGTPSGANAFVLQTAQTAIIEETGLKMLPGDYREDATISAKVLVESGAPAGWGAGIAFRYRDAENHYRFRFSSGGIALDKVVAGTKSTVWSQSVSHSTNTWYTLEVVTNGSSITLKKNGTTLTTATDSSFLTGDTALIALNSATARFDDVTATGGTTTSWNFDSNTVGTVPSDWQRYGPYDLSDVWVIIM